MKDANAVAKALDFIDEKWMDPAERKDNGYTDEHSAQDIKELIGMCRGLLVALDAMVAARAVITVHNGKER